MREAHDGPDWHRARSRQALHDAARPTASLNLATDGTPVGGPLDLAPRCLTWSCETGASDARGGRVPRTYDPEFRRRVVELVRAGRPVRVVAAELAQKDLAIGQA
jgi:hypothetical protein